MIDGEAVEVRVLTRIVAELADLLGEIDASLSADAQENPRWEIAGMSRPDSARTVTKLRLGRAEEALAAADDALAAAPIDGRALALKAYALLDLGRDSEADLYWLRAEAFAPDKGLPAGRGTSGCGARRWRRSRLRPRRRNGSDARRARPSAFSPALNRISRSEPIRRRI